MIGSGLKKLAKENGMTVAHGVAYGSLGGYAATLSEGQGYKKIVFTTLFSDPAAQAAMMNYVGSKDVQKEFRVRNLGIGPRAVQVEFLDNPGTMKKIRLFLDWFLPLLRHYGASGVMVCPECGYSIENGHWAMVNGIAYHFHENCAQKVRQEIGEDNNRRKKEDRGTYLTGFLGAVGGSVLGAVLWAFVMSLGYIASLVGLAMGWFAEKGYNLLKGKQGKGKVPILIFAIVIGVLLGTLAAEAITVFGMIQSGELAGLAIADIPLLIALVFADDPEYRRGVISNVVMGLLFAALGVYALLRKAGKEVSGVRYIDLP